MSDSVSYQGLAASTAGSRLRRNDHGTVSRFLSMQGFAVEPMPLDEIDPSPGATDLGTDLKEWRYLVTGIEFKRASGWLAIPLETAFFKLSWEDGQSPVTFKLSSAKDPKARNGSRRAPKYYLRAVCKCCGEQLKRPLCLYQYIHGKTRRCWGCNRAKQKFGDRSGAW